MSEMCQQACFYKRKTEGCCPFFYKTATFSRERGENECKSLLSDKAGENVARENWFMNILQSIHLRTIRCKKLAIIARPCLFPPDDPEQGWEFLAFYSVHSKSVRQSIRQIVVPLVAFQTRKSIHRNSSSITFEYLQQQKDQTKEMGFFFAKFGIMMFKNITRRISTFIVSSPKFHSLSFKNRQQNFARKFCFIWEQR